MTTRVHLSTEELLLQCDSELGFERTAHLDECEECRCALVDLATVLSKAELELRVSVPAETAESHEAAWASLEARLRSREKVKPFPLRWAAVYAAAAALGFVVISGYLSLEFFGTQPPSPAVEIADAVEPAKELIAPSEVVPSENVSASLGPAPAAAQAQTTEAAVASTPRAVPRLVDEPRSAPARFKFPTAQDVSQPPSRSAIAELSAPSVEAKWVSPSNLPANVLSINPVEPTPVPLRPRAQEFAALTPRAAEAVIDGHWILYQAKVWREDIAPAWTAAGLVLRGSVENEAAKRGVLRAIERTKGGSDIATDLRLRGVASNTPTVALASEKVEQRPSGGVVRTSLLAHFGDAARRSFVAPEPSVLQGEIDHFVSDVFENQSELLAHVYALKSILVPVDAGQADALGSDARAKIRKLADFHLSAVSQAQARIYDRLSETLPRKFWSYRASKKSLARAPDWRGEAVALLGDTLELDATLTALLSTPESTLDASHTNLSCGSLLSRIRGRVRYLRAGTDSLR